MLKMFLRLFAVLLFFVTFCFTSAHAVKEPFSIDDYFNIKNVTELAISSDGQLIAYIVESRSLEQNKTMRAVYISTVTSRTNPIFIEGIQNAKSLAWIPRSHELAYLANIDGVTQLYSINTKTKTVRQHTNGAGNVVMFRFAPDGTSLGWLTDGSSKDAHAPLYERLYHGEEGVVIDFEETVVYQFINRAWPNFAEGSQNTLWLKRMNSAAVPIETPSTQVANFYWSSDASKLSISYIADCIPKHRRFSNSTSIGIFDVPKKAFRPIAVAEANSDYEYTERFTGGEWIPGRNALFIRRTITHKHRKVSTAWTIFDFEEKAQFDRHGEVWYPIDYYYDDDPRHVFIPTANNAVFSNRTVGAKRSLYRITPHKIEKASIIRDLGGSISLFQFSANFETAAFVNQSFTRPPEIFIWHKGSGVTKLTELNGNIAEKQLPSFREVYWKSKNGVRVQGWLLEPPGDNKQPWPLLTFVHGGPEYAAKNEFAGYFHLWPYPFELYALNGIAVFIPNYRGSATFGPEFRNPRRIDKEPIDDIVSGVAHLIDEGIADSNRMAISGHSYGAWLASLLMAREKTYQAGSFAEGTPNSIIMYYLMPAWLNRFNHDMSWGVSLYDDPQRYIDTSADFHFKGLKTAVLFEAGANSLAIAMMGAPKAAARVGMPTEFVVYPKTGHNPHIPQIQRESASRNLEWFRFWLQGYESLAPEGQERYVRWRKIRDQQCAQPPSNLILPYCGEQAKHSVN